MELDRRQDGVARLLEAEQQSLADRSGRDVAALPEALLGARRGDDEEPFDAEARRRREQPSEDGHPRERHHELEGPLGRRVGLEVEGELEPLVVDPEDPPPPHATADHADPQRIAGLRAQDLPCVALPPADDARDRTPGVDLLGLEQQAIHASAPRIRLLESRT